MDEPSPDSTDRPTKHTARRAPISTSPTPGGASSSLETTYGFDAELDAKRPRRILASSTCPLCATSNADRLYRLPEVDKRIVTCPECGIARLDPMPAPDELASYYPTDYYGTGGQKFDTLLERILAFVGKRLVRSIRRRVTPGGRILDVGCGRGLLAQALVDAGFRVCGTDFSRDATRGIDPRIDLRICASLAHAKLEAGSFDAVVVWHVLEHLTDPAETLDEIRRLLKPGGRLFLAVPNFSSLQARLFGRHWFHLDPPRHLHQFPARALAEMLERRRLVIRRTAHFSLRQNPFGWIQSALNALPGARRNALYCAMHNVAGKRTTSRRDRCERSLNLLAAGPAILLSIATAAFRTGATVSFEAQKRVRS